MLIELNHVTKLYGRVIGVNDVTLKLERGAYGLLGPNGAGKSTLLNLLTGQLKQTIGSVRVLGHRPLNCAALFRQIGYCPGGEGLYAHVSGLDWVEYLQELQGFDRVEANDRAKAALDAVGMTQAMHRPLSTYSRGMRQRTKLAQAIAHDPEFLILDEPFSGLDPVGRHEITETLLGWVDRGKSLLLASHVLHEIESVTDSFLLICSGRLLASGTRDEVRQILANLPNEVTIVCDRTRELSQRLVHCEHVTRVQIEGEQLVVSPDRRIS